MKPDFLVVGHIALDRKGNSLVPGGTAAYVAITAQRLGLKVGVLTSAPPDLELGTFIQGVEFCVVLAASATSFLNRYRDGKRTQFILSRASNIGASDIPAQWLGTPIVLLGPISHEVESSIAAAFPNSLVGASLQGWLRKWDSRGRVSYSPWLEADRVLPHLGAAFLSLEDTEGDTELARRYAGQVPFLALTLGEKGAQVWWKGQSHFIRPYPAREVDPTGAGDVFAAAYLVRFSETRDPLESARFASCAASLSVEGVGVETIPTRAQVYDRLKAFEAH